MYCPNCASENGNDVKFCTRCGLNLKAVSDLLNDKTLDSTRSEEIDRLLAKCHNGYLSTVIGLCLMICALLIVIASIMSAAQSEMKSILNTRSELNNEEDSQKWLSSEGAKSVQPGFAGSVTEGTTANLDHPS
jgi:uncharacterized membrane protein YvbJ